MRFLTVLMLALCMFRVAAVDWQAALEPMTADDPPLNATQIARSLVVNFVEEGGAADRAGLRRGDRVIALDGWRVHDEAEYTLVRWFGSSMGEPLRLLVLREGAVLAFELRSNRARTGAFHFDFNGPADVLPAVLVQRGWIPDPGTDPWTWRSWRQFPGRWAAKILAAESAADGGPPPWFPTLSTLWCHLCQQEFAEAAQVTLIAPPESLQRPVAFWQALAAQHAAGEQDPDPAACGVDRLAFILWYPWPLVTGPLPGEGLGPELAGVVEEARQLPALMQPDRTQWTNRAQTRFSTADPVFAGPAGSYVSMLWFAAFEPDTHGGWPYRHHSIWDKKERAEVIADLQARLAEAKDPHAVWIRTGYWMATLVDAMRHWDNRSLFLTALENQREGFRTVAADSPWLAWRMLSWLPHAVHPEMHRVRSVRHAIRELVDEAEFAITPVPSRLLEWCHARDPGVEFALGEAHSGTSGSDPLSAWQAFAAPYSLAELVAAIAALPIDAGPDAREPLLDGWVTIFQGRVQAHDVGLIAPLFSSGQASGLLMDRFPDLLRWQWATREDDDFLEPMRQILFPEQRFFDRDALRQALASVPWDQDPAPAIEAIRRAYGHPIGAQVIAEACFAHGQGALAEPIQAQVATVMHAYWRFMRARGFNARDQAVSDGWSAVVFAISRATAAQAITAGVTHGERRGKLGPWAPVCLAMAQAHVLLDQDAQAVDALIQSLSAEDFAFTFFGPYGSLQNASAHRTWLLNELAQRGRLDAATQRRIVVAGRPGCFDPAGLELLGVYESQLGAEAAAVNDF